MYVYFSLSVVGNSCCCCGCFVVFCHVTALANGLVSEVSTI